jgi:dihydroorotase-like cyclic amidohydrolase
MHDLAIRGDRTEIAIDDGTIAAAAPEVGGVREELDARGLTIFSGVIDVHLAFHEAVHRAGSAAALKVRTTFLAELERAHA